ncbi:hypothetical protein D3C81_2136380 [compost metagenome]
MGETDFCAQFIATWITALIAPSPKALSNSNPEKSGSGSWVGTTIMNDSAEAVASCTTVTLRTSTLPA